jgi:hypothetical protein
MKNSLALSLLVIAGAMTPVAFGQSFQFSYAATAKTVASNTGDPNTSPTATRLFTAPGVAARLNTSIWFIADTNRDGINTSPTESQTFQSLAAGTNIGDDYLLHVNTVNGSLLNTPANIGRFQGIITVNDDVEAPGGLLKNANIWVVLWNGEGAAFDPQAGDTFGALNLGVELPPTTGSGNAFWAIDSNIVANQFTVLPISAVPEPSTYAALAGVGLVGFALWRRRAVRA